MPESAPQIELTWDQALSWRVNRQRLDDPSSDPVEITAVLGGVQAQVVSASLQVISIRSGTVPDLDALFGFFAVNQAGDAASASGKRAWLVDLGSPPAEVEDHPGV